MSNDLISRQAAYETLSEYYHHKTEMQHEALREALGSVPSAQPQRKTGQWRTGKYDTAGKMKVMTVKCSSCGKEATSLISTDGLLWNIKMVYDFCPNCGAEMKGKNDG